MKIVCTIILLITCVFSLFCPFFAIAQEVSWVRITKNSVLLYATQEATKGMFLLEKSYYLEVISQLEDMYFVSLMDNSLDFPQITGYVFKKDVELCETAPITPYYPQEILTVCSHSATIKLTPNPSAEVLLTATNTQQVSYYGTIVSYKKTWYYVKYADTFGYVESDMVTQPNIQLHPMPLVKPTVPVEETPTTPTEQQPTENISPTAEVILIVFVALLALAITFALFLPVKTKGVFEQDI